MNKKFDLLEICATIYDTEIVTDTLNEKRIIQQFKNTLIKTFEKLDIIKRKGTQNDEKFMYQISEDDMIRIMQAYLKALNKIKGEKKQ